MKGKEDLIRKVEGLFIRREEWKTYHIAAIQSLGEMAEMDMAKVPESVYLKEEHL